MGGRVCRLVEVDDTVLEVLLDGTLQWGTTCGERGVVAGADVEALVVLQEYWPLGGVD